MKDREYNDQEKKIEKNNELQKTKDWVSRIPLKTGGETHVLWKLTYVFLYEKYGYVLYRLKM